MFKNGMLLSAALAVMLIGAPLSAKPLQTTGSYEFVGFSFATIDGDPGGIPGVYEACQDEFGPNARMCTRVEFYLSPLIAYPGTPAWISQSEPNNHDQLGCDGFLSTGGNGNAIDTNGQVIGAGCGSSRPITCCTRVK